ncbi:XdhC family protein [bacterium]|nr:XdhC family protein [bacterium]MBU1652404.1 XdhC family protein [bacterium]
MNLDQTQNIWKAAAEIGSRGMAAALVTVIGTKGSTPREVGAKMIVKQDGSIVGTVGGSIVEAMAIKEALQVISTGKPRRVVYDLNETGKQSTGMLCGGQMEFFIESISAGPHLIIFGGGHVGLEVARLAAQLGYRHTVCEEREEYGMPARFPHAANVLHGGYTALTRDLEVTTSDYIIIVTHSHDCDTEVLRGVLGKSYGYLGMICSKRKRKEVFQLLTSEGFDSDELERVHAPIGLEIGAKTPAEIAVSILAEVVREYYGKG